MKDLNAMFPLWLLAQRQVGLFSLGQAHEFGVATRQLTRAVEAGRLRQPHPNVYCSPGTPTTWRWRLWAAVLAAGLRCSVAYESAAALRGVEGYPPGPVVLSVPHPDHTRLEGVVVHQTRHPWTPESIDGLPVTPLAATFVDLAGVSSRVRLAKAIDHARNDGLVSIRDIAEALQTVAGPGRKGTRMLASILDTHRPGEIVDGSVAETLLHRLIAEAGLPPLAKQQPLPGRGAVPGRVDGMWHRPRVIVEVDSRTWHDRIHQRRIDNQRDHEATRHGWVVIRIYYEDLLSDPAGMMAMLADVLAVRATA